MRLVSKQAPACRPLLPVPRRTLPLNAPPPSPPRNPGRSASWSERDPSGGLDDAQSKPGSCGVSPPSSLQDLPPPSLLLRGASPAAAGAAALPGGTATQAQQYWQEVQRRTDLEAVLKELRSQLDDVMATVAARGGGRAAAPAGAAPAAAVAAALEVAAAEAATRVAAAQAAAAAAAEGLEVRLHVARLVAGALSRAAAAADLGAAWDKERQGLQRRLEQAAAMSEAMLRRQQARLGPRRAAAAACALAAPYPLCCRLRVRFLMLPSCCPLFPPTLQAARAEVEPWRHLLLNGLVTASCLGLGAAAAVLIVRHHST